MKTSLFIYFTIISNYCFSQNIKNLEENNGFRQYKLGSLYNASYGAKEKYLDGEQRVTVKNAIEYISDIPVNVIELFYIQDTLTSIILRFKSSYGIQLKNACESAFGKPTEDNSNTEITRMFNKDQKKDIFSGDFYSLKWRTNIFKFSYYYSLLGGLLHEYNTCYLVYRLNDYDKRAQRAKKKYSSKDF